MPTDSDLLQEWKRILSNHRQTHANMICSEHFNPNDIVIRKDRCILRPNSKPSIFKASDTQKTVNVFDTNENVADVVPDFNYMADFVGVVDGSNDQGECENCKVLNDRCDELQRKNLFDEHKILQLNEELEHLTKMLRQCEVAKLVSNKNFDDVQRENNKNESKIHELSGQLKTLKNQVNKSQLAQFALKNDFADAKVFFNSL